MIDKRQKSEKETERRCKRLNVFWRNKGAEINTRPVKREWMVGETKIVVWEIESELVNGLPPRV